MKIGYARVSKTLPRDFDGCYRLEAELTLYGWEIYEALLFWALPQFVVHTSHDFIHLSVDAKIRAFAQLIEDPRVNDFFVEVGQ